MWAVFVLGWEPCVAHLRLRDPPVAIRRVEEVRVVAGAVLARGGGGGGADLLKVRVGAGGQSWGEG